MVEVVKRANDQKKLFSNLTFFLFFQMMVEEVKKAKELAIQPKAKRGDDEPDWQDVSQLPFAF
jgi:hypothetical protein